MARVKGDWLIKRPAALTRRRGHGDRHGGLHRHAVRAGARAQWRHARRGPVIVTGAAGGVGSVAIILLARLGYHVIASTGRTSEADYLGPRAQPRSSTGRSCERPPAARQGALGRRHRRRRQPHACQCSGHDPVWRQRRRLRPWLKAWTLSPRSHPSSCAASRSPASTR